MEKPEVLTTLQRVLPTAFEILGKQYGVPPDYRLDLRFIDAVDEEQLSRQVEVAAVTMRKIQLLHVHSPLGVRTPNDVVVGLCTEIVRALASLLQTTPSLSPEDRAALILTLQAVHQCGVVVGTMVASGELLILE